MTLSGCVGEVTAGGFGKARDHFEVKMYGLKDVCFENGIDYRIKNIEGKFIFI